MVRLRRRLDLTARGPSDSGMTLIEMLVAMMLFTVLIGVFMSGIAVMTDSTVRTQAATGSSDEIRRAYQRLDKQIRYASAVNAPGLVGGNEYIEFETTAVAPGEDPTCTQWKLDAAADTLAFRTWPDLATATASTWTVVASRVLNVPATEPVFTFQPVDEAHTKQRVDVFLKVKDARGDGAELKSSFVALNTTPTTVTNEVIASGASKYPVCQQVGRT